MCKTHVIEGMCCLMCQYLENSSRQGKLPIMLTFVSRACVFKDKCSIDFLKSAICKRCYQQCHLHDCEISKGRPGVLLVFCVYSLASASLLIPPVPRTVFYVSRCSVCMLNKVTFRCFLLRRIIYPHHSFTPNILSKEFLRGNHYVFLKSPVRNHFL